MYCPNCRNEMSDEGAQHICPHCGTRMSKNHADEQAPQYTTQQQAQSDDRPSFGYGLLGFLIPLVGLILYIVWRKDYPLRARSAGRGALIFLAVSFISGVIAGLSS